MMRFRLLGPLEVWTAGEWQGIGAPKWRSLLAVLLVRAGQAVPVDTLIEELWGGAPPAKAANLVSIYVLRLRRLLGDADGSLLVTRAPGYLLRPGPDGTDARQFEDLIRAGRQASAAGQADVAAARLAEALTLWHGRPLADVLPTPLVEAEATRLGELRLDAIELRLAAELSCGSPADAVSELRGLVAEHPLREGLWVLLMRALDAGARHAEALEVYGLARAAIAEQLGVEPGAELRQLYAELLAQDTTSAGLIAAGSVRAGQGTAEADQTVSPRPGVPVPAQLPADIADFTGREDQVKRLCELLAGPGADGADGVVPIALVAGSGGLGKTSLAVHAAHRVRGLFPDGQLYVDLLGATATPLAAADVLARFLRDLGVDGRRIPAEPDERAAWYRSSLAGRRILVVLDNARDAAQVRPLLPGTGSSAVLVTTRSRMPDLASTRLVDLNVLADEEALALFTKVVGDERAAAEPEATAELLLACAGLPLAIRICAARLATRPGWTIGAMATRLRDTRRRLDELRVGDLAVRASFQVSFASLPADTPPVGAVAASTGPADAFRLLGLWPGPSISAAAAAALFAATEGQAADALETLVDAHLLESTGPDRYKFHDLLRVYSSERAEDLPAAVREAASMRLLAWYAAAADAAATAVLPHRYDIPLDLGPGAPEPPRFYGPEDALAWYDDERANLVAATRHAAALGLDELAWRLPAPLFMVFNSRGNLADCITTHRIALEAARRAGNRPGEAWVLNNLGESLGATRESEGIGHLEQSLVIRHEIADQRGEAQVANNLADAYQRLGRADEALGLLKRALELNQQQGYSYGEGVALGNLGSTLLDLGRAAEAVDYLLQARQVFSDIGYLAGEGYVLHILGRCYSALGQDADAMTCLEQALATHRSTGNRQQEAATLRSVGTAQRRAGLADEARASWTRAAAAFDELGDPAQAAEIRAELVASGI